MIEENGIRDQPNPTFKQRSLLTKYEVPVEHLSYEYIGICKDVKELERIVRILRSGEEGYYPDLQKTAEERLRSLSPNNRHLRVEEPVLTRNNMHSDEWNNVISDVTNWQNEISLRDLKLTEENNNTMDDIDLPPVRQPPPNKSAPEKKSSDATVKMKRAKNYGEWDKYDADTEIVKMDLEEEREKERVKEENERQRSQAETDRLEHVVKEAEQLSETERQVLAEQEKERGNEYYKVKECTEAIKYYTASIAIWPTPNAYNNRAACYLKQCKYSAALSDTSITLEMDPDNVKALFRRGIALQHKNMFREALKDMDAVSRRQPKNLLAQHISKELREQMHTQSKTIRIMTDEGLNKPKKIVEMNVNSLTKESLAGCSYEVNEFGLPKVMCQCNGSPRFLQLPSRKCSTPHFQPRPPPIINNARIVELNDEPELPKATTKLEIVEVEKSVPIEDVCNPLKCNEVGKPDNIENFYKPTKYVVLDKRTQKNVVTNGDTNTILTNGDCNMESSFGESRMDKDCELNNCPLLEESYESVLEPPV